VATYPRPKGILPPPSTPPDPLLRLSNTAWRALDRLGTPATDGHLVHSVALIITVWQLFSAHCPYTSPHSSPMGTLNKNLHNQEHWPSLHISTLKMEGAFTLPPNVGNIVHINTVHRPTSRMKVHIRTGSQNLCSKYATNNRPLSLKYQYTHPLKWAGGVKVRYAWRRHTFFLYCTFYFTSTIKNE
jgi:hypothetical protein